MMKKSEQIFFTLLKSELTGQPLLKEEKENLFKNVTLEEWGTIADFATMHRVEPLLFEALKLNPGIPVPKPVTAFLKDRTFQVSMCYYQLVQLTAELVHLLEAHHLSCYVLKGVGLCCLYPKEELRASGDIDIYVPDKDEFQFACRLIAQNGGTEEKGFSNYHCNFQYEKDGMSCELELHRGLCAEYEKKFDRQITSIYEGVPKCAKEYRYPMGISIPVLPTTYSALYLLMHMFQHFMSKGFGVRLLCDWVLFWNHQAELVDMEQFTGWIESLHLEKFLSLVTEICVKNLGLNSKQCKGLTESELVKKNLPEKELESAFLEDLIQGGEFGKWDPKRMLITTRAPGSVTYLRELHRQMKKRFPKACRIVVIWPILWIVTGIAFVYNNIRVRKVSTKEIMDSNEKRNKMVKKMEIFK